MKPDIPQAKEMYKLRDYLEKLNRQYNEHMFYLRKEGEINSEEFIEKSRKLQENIDKTKAIIEGFEGLFEVFKTFTYNEYRFLRGTFDGFTITTKIVHTPIYHRQQAIYLPPEPSTVVPFEGDLTGEYVPYVDLSEHEYRFEWQTFGFFERLFDVAYIKNRDILLIGTKG